MPSHDPQLTLDYWAGLDEEFLRMIGFMMEQLFVVFGGDLLWPSRQILIRMMVLTGDGCDSALISVLIIIKAVAARQIGGVL